MSPSPLPTVIIILGPTAVGKTALSIELAKKYKGEVVSADSRQVYTGLDIGTGKVTKEEMEGVPHHLLDVADPRDVYTASDFVKEGREAIEEICERSHLPLIVGGTGFYIDALLGTISLTEVAPNEVLRDELEQLSLQDLRARLAACAPNLIDTIDLNNPRRLIRAIEIAESGKTLEEAPSTPLYKTIYIGLTIPLEELRIKIRTRLEMRLKAGMLEEAKSLHESGLSYERMDALGLEYRYMAQHLAGDISYEEMSEAIERESVRYARRQMTWFKRNKNISWFRPEETEKVFEYVEEGLSN